MSLRFRDSFDHYAAADMTKKWTSGNFAAIATTWGRFGSGGRIFGTTATKTLDSQSTWIVGGAWRTPGFGANLAGILWLDSGTAQLSLLINALGGLSLFRGTASTGTLLGSTANSIITIDVWAYVELKVTINNTTGSYEVRVNGANVLSASGVDTQNTANASANQFQVTASGNVAMDLDDFYICDASGSTNNDFLGDVRVEAILPGGAGTTTQWTPSAGSNFQNVDDATPDGDTTYNSSSTLNQVDTYAYGNLTPTTGTVYGVAVMEYARKDDAGARSIAPVVRHSGTDYVGTTQALSTSYQYLEQTYETNPGTSAAWTISEVNAAEFGIKLSV